MGRYGREISVGTKCHIHSRPGSRFPARCPLPFAPHCVCCSNAFKAREAVPPRACVQRAPRQPTPSVRAMRSPSYLRACARGQHAHVHDARLTIPDSVEGFCKIVPVRSQHKQTSPVRSVAAVHGGSAGAVSQWCESAGRSQHCAGSTRCAVLEHKAVMRMCAHPSSTRKAVMRMCAHPAPSHPGPVRRVDEHLLVCSEHAAE